VTLVDYSEQSPKKIEREKREKSNNIDQKEK